MIETQESQRELTAAFVEVSAPTDGA
jgi:hypothetical protein